MAKTPVVGIPYIGKGFENHYMMVNYKFALRRAGAQPKVLRPSEDPAVLAQYLDQCDGFLMPGGEDIDPGYYGREKEPACGEANKERDSFELALLRALLPTQKPILGICRGCQALAVVSGGTLIQDIAPKQRVNHRAAKSQLRKERHEIKLVGESILRKIVPSHTYTMQVNTLHHQVVENTGSARVVAYSPDGFVEAIQRDDRPFCLGVQWHPEQLVLKNELQQKIFETFVQACR